MDKTILAFIEKLELYKTKIKALHWDSDNLSQHKLCDEIADSIAEFQDQVSEVEQSISGKLPKNMFRPDNQEYGEVGTLKEFVKTVIDTTNEFYKKLQDKGDEYIGMRSDCESFLSDMQRKLYLVNFTMKEDMKRRITEMVNESRPKNLANIPDDSKIEKLKGRRPTTYEGRKNQIIKITNMFGVGKKVYTDESWEAIDEYSRAISLLEIVDDVDIFPCADLNKPEWDIQSDGGYCDYDEQDHMPRSKRYKIIITYFDGMKIEGYIKCMAAGTIEKPFSRYDTCMVLWPKNNRTLGENKEMSRQHRLSEDAFMDDWFNRKEEEHLEKVRKELRNKAQEDFYQRHPDFRGNGGRVEESRNMKKQIKLTESELKQVVKEAAMKVLSETPLNYDIDNFSGRWNKNTPDEELNPDDYLDNPYDAPNSWDDDGWVDGDKDMENKYSWNAFDRQAIAPGVEAHYNVMKTGVPGEIDKAISWRNKDNDWSEMELRNRDRMMGKWINGERDADDIGDSWEDIHYESKEPRKTMRMTESELKQVVREAAMRVINEMSTAEREKRLEKQMSWRDLKKKNNHDDAEKLRDLIDKGAEYQKQTKDMHKENPNIWRKMIAEK